MLLKNVKPFVLALIYYRGPRGRMVQFDMLK